MLHVRVGHTLPHPELRLYDVPSTQKSSETGLDATTGNPAPIPGDRLFGSVPSIDADHSRRGPDYRRREIDRSRGSTSPWLCSTGASGCAYSAGRHRTRD